jgi:hypothetical protein
MSRPFYGIFNEREWPQVVQFADREAINVSELVRRGIKALAKEKGVVIAIDDRKDYFSRRRPHRNRRA